eukprot:COSAG02_NODE_20849_length_813_cov_1.362745_2_plen_100_part_01
MSEVELSVEGLLERPVRHDAAVTATGQGLQPADALGEDALTLEGWDLGGHPIYLVLQNLYVKRNCLYCVMFDMRQLVRIAATKVRKKALGILLSWLNSIV